MSYGRSYYAGHEGNDVREKTVPKPAWGVLLREAIDDAKAEGRRLAAEMADTPMCCVCQMPMRDEKPCHWIGEEPMHKDCVGPSIVGVRKG